MSGEQLEFDPSQTIRIALLHHHPVVTYSRYEFVKTTGFKRIFGRPTEFVKQYRDDREAKLVQMEGADDFLNGCLKWGIQLILFGHQHYPYRRLVMAKGQSHVENPIRPPSRCHPDLLLPDNFAVRRQGERLLRVRLLS